jgi:hypothetical protein
MKEKLKLSELQLESFVTSLCDEDSMTVQGGVATISAITVTPLITVLSPCLATGPTSPCPDTNVCCPQLLTLNGPGCNVDPAGDWVALSAGSIMESK